MTLFVGGQRHGTDQDMDRTPPTADGVRDLPPSFVDSTTGEAYVRVPVMYQLNNPLTNHPIPGQVWEQDIYLLTTLIGEGPENGMAYLRDSVTRWWFTTFGTRKSTEESVAESNGHQTIYSAKCEGCVHAWVFDTQTDRARFMRIHIDETGHTMRWSDDAATIEGVYDDGRSGPGDVQEG